MENTVKITMENAQKGQLENSAQSINLIITLTPDKIMQLKEELRDTENIQSDSFCENLIKAIHKSEATFHNVKPLSELETAVTELMNHLGIPAHTKGYRYLRDAIVLSTENPGYIDQVTKVLYPAVAKTYNTTPVRVERVMRHAIEYCCTKGNTDAVCLYFSHCLASQRGKPTNSEFIAVLSDKLRMKA